MVVAGIVGTVWWLVSTPESIVGGVLAGGVSLVVITVHLFMAAMGYADMNEREQTAGTRALLALTVLVCLGVVAAAVVLGGNGEILPALATPVGMVAAWLLLMAADDGEWGSRALWERLWLVAIWPFPPLAGLATAIALGGGRT